MNQKNTDILKPFSRPYSEYFDISFQLENDLLVDILNIVDESAVAASLWFYSYVDFRPINDFVRGLAFLTTKKTIYRKLLDAFDEHGANKSTPTETRYCKGMLVCLFYSKYYDQPRYDRLSKIRHEDPNNPSQLEKHSQDLLDKLIKTVDRLHDKADEKIESTENDILEYFLNAMLLIIRDPKLTLIANAATELFFEAYNNHKNTDRENEMIKNELIKTKKSI